MFLAALESGAYSFDGRYWMAGKPDAGMPAKGYFDLAKAADGIELAGHYYNPRGIKRSLSVRVEFSDVLMRTGEFRVTEQTKRCTSGAVALLDSEYLLSGYWDSIGFSFAVRVRELTSRACGVSGVMHIPELFPVAFEGKLLPHHSEHALENIVSITKGPRA
jgi:hypothetical protein